jgi:hypothetical protein
LSSSRDEGEGEAGEEWEAEEEEEEEREGEGAEGKGEGEEEEASFPPNGGAGVHGCAGLGASGKCIGQSASGLGLSSSSSSKAPAHWSRLVRNVVRLKRLWIVDGIEDSSNWGVTGGNGVEGGGKGGNAM